MRPFLVIAVCAGLLTACTSSPAPAPAPESSPPATTRPTAAVSYTAGSADVAVTGAEQATFTANVDSAQAEFALDDGFDVWWRTGEQALNVSGDVKDGTVDAFVRVETAAGDTHAYVDSFHTICDVVVTAYSETELAGTLSCEDLPAMSGETKVSVQATFSATA